VIGAVSGEALMVAGCFLTAAMGGFTYSAHLAEPELSSIAISFVRVCMNLVLVCALVSSVSGSTRKIWPTKRGWLWAWGVAGAATVSTYFFSVTRLGMGEATFLQSSYAVFAILLAPWLLGERVSARSATMVSGSVVGLALLFSPQGDPAQWQGAAAALFSGLTAAIAYVSVAKAGKQHTPATVLFFWTLLCLPLHLAALIIWRIALPHSVIGWGYVLAAGTAGALSQYCIAIAYQRGPVAAVSAVSYLAPLLCMMGDWVFFDFRFTGRSLIGAGCILFFGVLLPFENRRRWAMASRQTSLDLASRLHKP
jgi:drug/metabolite transporter (DMT)-like permease